MKKTLIYSIHWIYSKLKNQLKEHNSGKVISTKKCVPFELICYEVCLNKKDAFKREKYFKTGFGRRFLKNRLENCMARNSG